MRTHRLAFTCCISLALLLAPGCKFYTEGVFPTDAVARDVEDVDPDVEPLTDATADAAPGPDAAITQCATVGGTCPTSGTVCPPGTRPYAGDDPLDCPLHCCVPDDISSCSADPDTNCSNNNECTGCWAPATDTELQCASGRACCEWDCP